MAVVCLLAADSVLVQMYTDGGNGWLHSVLYHQLMPISCHLPKDCKALLATTLAHV